MVTMKALNDIFQMVFDDDTIQIRPEMTADDIDGWDSLSHVNLITAIEANFHIKFMQKELLKLKNVDDLYRLISEKISG